MEQQDNCAINEKANATGTTQPSGFTHFNSLSRKHGKSASGGSPDDVGVIRVPSGSGFRIVTPFPWRLHEILEDIEVKELNWIVGWTPDGKAFQVLNQSRFEDTILPMYFRHNRYKSFQVSKLVPFTE
jgi:HSF-type DNA-binding